MNTLELAPVSDRTAAERTAVIRQLNDTLRRTGEGGWTLVTNGITALPKATQDRVFAEIARFDRGGSGNLNR